MWFSHTANVEWNYWTGFSPSRDTDNADYVNTEDCLKHQWTAMSQGGISGKGTPYMVANIGMLPAEIKTVDDAPCTVCFGNPKSLTTFKPQSMQINNTSYAYYTILNGSAYSKKFAEGDWFKLNVYGVREGGETVGPVECYLADFRNGKSEIVKDWTFINLDTLGEVQFIYFTMESSDTGQWGMNTPAYFCMDRLKVQL